MKLGLLSDSHNDEQFIKKALEVFRERRVALIVHCGDLTSPQMVRLFEGFEVYFVEGNMDSHREAIAKAVEETEGPKSYGRKWEAELEGKKLAACHGDDLSLLNELLWSGEYDYVFHGHIHRLRDERVGKTRVINPGAYDTKTICILDLGADQLEVIELE